LITLFFYLFSHIIIAFYFRTLSAKSYSFNKDIHEKDLDIFVKEINKREKLIDSAIKITEMVTKMNSDELAGEKK